MKVVYFLQNPGVASRTPPGWESSVVSPGADGSCAEADVEEIATADVLVAGLAPVTESMLARATRLKLVQRLGVGYDNIDLEAAARLGIPVCNMADFNAVAVAEHTLMMILALLRRVFEATLLMKGARWPTQEVIGGGTYGLEGKHLGLVGFGHIGEAVARRATAFGVTMTYWDRRQRSPAEARTLGVQFSSLQELIRECDVLSLHLPHTPDTHHLIGRAELDTMKPTAVLVNTARGSLVDEMALAAALRSGKLAGAGLDVFETEPLPIRHPLRSCPNVLMTPHTAGQTREAMERMVSFLLDNLSRVRHGQPLRNLIPQS